MRRPSAVSRRLFQIRNGFQVVDSENRVGIEAGREDEHWYLRFFTPSGACVLNITSDADGGCISVLNGNAQECVRINTHSEGGAVIVLSDQVRDGEGLQADLYANHAVAGLVCSASGSDFAELVIRTEGGPA